MADIGSRLEHHQTSIYFGAITFGAGVSFLVAGTAALESLINPALGLMLFVTFLQVPVAEMASAFRQGRFLIALLVANFVVVPAIVALLVAFLPDDPMLRIGVLFVLLMPCIDYVVTFAHLGKGNAGLLLAATPVLLLLQLLLLPLFVGFFLGDDAASLIRPAPFLHAFLWLIVLPLCGAWALQALSARKQQGRRLLETLRIFPVPATALVLFLVIAAVMPRIAEAGATVLAVVPIYLAYAVVAPLAGWLVARLLRLDAAAGRAVCFSAATRNSLVVLPLAAAVPGGLSLVAGVIVMQTIVELIAELAYIRLIPLLPWRETVLRSSP